MESTQYIPLPALLLTWDKKCAKSLLERPGPLCFFLYAKPTRTLGVLLQIERKLFKDQARNLSADGIAKSCIGLD